MAMATSADSDHEWLQFVEEVQMSSPATSSGGDGGKLMTPPATASPSSSVDHHDNHNHQLLSPMACISKPARRRPRAPRRTPATLLAANTANFRALVQKFTGRPAPAPFSSTSHRGPLTLNFELGTQQSIHPFGSDYHHRRRHVEPPPPPFFPSDGQTIAGDVLLSTINTDDQNSHGGFTTDNISLGPAGLNMDDNNGYFW